ncbi:MAG: hypothetical protein R6X06_10360 [Gammaproteobacteria bacterium]
MSDKDEPIDNNAALLKSLESIKALLAQSETKLSAARESLHIANQGTTMRKPKADNDIPTLEEIIEVGQQIQIDLPDDADIPVVQAAIDELAGFNFKVEADLEETEPTMTLDTSAFAFAFDDHDQDTDDDSLSDIPVLSIDALEEDADRDARPYPAPAATPAAAAAAVVEAQDEPAVVAPPVPLPDLGPLLDAIDDAEGNMRAQISAAAIAFEDQLNNQLDAQMRQLRERVYALVEKYGA